MDHSDNIRKPPVAADGSLDQASIEVTDMASLDSTFQRFASKVQPDPTECWVWTASKSSNGYGLFSLNGRTIRAHRWAYEHWLGQIPDGMVINHLCRNRVCVFPGHLEAITPDQNTIAGTGGGQRMHFRLYGEDHRACDPMQCPVQGHYWQEDKDDGSF